MGDSLADRYVRALDLALIGATYEAGVCRLVAGTKTEATRALTSETGKPSSDCGVLASADVRAWWVRDLDRASLLAAECSAEMRRLNIPPRRQSAFVCELAIATRVIEQTALALGVLLHDDASVRAIAASAVAKLEHELQVLQGAGGMKSVNKAYREYRLAKTAAQEKYIGYSRWLFEYKANVIEAVAINSRINF